MGLGFWGEEVAEVLGGGEEVLEFDFVEGFEDFKQLSEVAVGVAHGGEDGGVILGDDAGPEGGVTGGDAGGVAEAVAGAAEDGGVVHEGGEGGDAGHELREVGDAGDFLVVAFRGHGGEDAAADGLPEGGEAFEVGG